MKSTLFAKRLFFLLMIFFSLQVDAQLVKQHVLQNAVSINSIQPDDTSFADLEPIANAIGNSRVVLLGEQDHGDAPAFLAKTRLIKYLHQKLGFEVLAFESDFYSLTSGWHAYEKGEVTLPQYLKDNIFPIWTECDACHPLFNYIGQTQKTSNALQVAGFDNQLHGKYRRQYFKSDFLTGLQQAGAPDKYAHSLSNFLTLVEKNYPLSKNNSLPFDSLVYYGQTLDSMVKWNEALPDSSYFKITASSLRANVYQAKYSNENNYESMTVRDKQMADNLLWLMKYQYPGKKIIVWAHNYHVAKNTYESMGAKSGRHYAMGYFLYPELKDEMYILGFTSYKGQAGRIFVKPFNIPNPKRNSIERWLAVKKTPFAFVDFRSMPQIRNEMFYMKGKFHTNAMAAWHTVFDGVFYIKDMYPCVRKSF